MLLKSPCRNLKSYDKPLWGFSNGTKKMMSSEVILARSAVIIIIVYFSYSNRYKLLMKNYLSSCTVVQAPFSAIEEYVELECAPNLALAQKGHCIS